MCSFVSVFFLSSELNAGCLGTCALFQSVFFNCFCVLDSVLFLFFAELLKGTEIVT